MNNLSTRLAEIEVSYKPKKVIHPIIKTSADAYTQLSKFFPGKTISLQEKFVVGYLNAANRLIGVYEMSRGGITNTIVDLRLLLAVALKTASTGVALAHNHPSGNLKPSNSDREITERVKEACKLFDIKLLDHLILSPNDSYFSFADEGLL